MKKTILALTVLILTLSSCSPEAQSTVADTSSQTSSVEAEYVWEDHGTGYFADAGELTPAQQDIILKYMDYYYDSLSALRLRDPEELFVENAAVSLEANRTVLEYLIALRSMQGPDLSLSSYQYDLTFMSMDQADDYVSVRLTEHSVQNFTAYPGVDTESFQVMRVFNLKQQSDGTWLISSHMQIDGPFWMVTGRYAFNRGETVSETEALAYFETRKNQLIESAENAVASRDRGEYTAPECDEEYDREAAVAYAMEWVGKRNEEWADYTRYGGNCQNFTSQCLDAGGIPMDTQSPGIWKWYGSTPDNQATRYGRSASWSAVDNFLEYVNANEGYGLSASTDAPYYSADVGDILHLGQSAEDIQHTVIITEVIKDDAGNTVDYLISSNTADLKNFPASAYPYFYQLLIKINGWNY